MNTICAEAPTSAPCDSPRRAISTTQCDPDISSASEDDNAMPVLSSSTDEESASFSKFLSKCTEKKTSRVGEDYQATHIPDAGSYLNLQGDDFDQLEQLLLTDQIWDPLRATCRGINDFVHLHCPPSKKEAALEHLHQRDYDNSLFSKEVQGLHVLDGSDWSLAEHSNFRQLMQTTRHNVKIVAKSMGKSINNCLTVYYKIINVRETRNTKKRFSGLKPMDEINELKDIGRSMRIAKRNERKRSIDTEDNGDSAQPQETATLSNNPRRKRKKTPAASDKIKNATLRPNSEGIKISTRTSPRKQKKLPVAEKEDKVDESMDSTQRVTRNRRNPTRQLKKAPLKNLEKGNQEDKSMDSSQRITRTMASRSKVNTKSHTASVSKASQATNRTRRPTTQPVAVAIATAIKTASPQEYTTDEDDDEDGDEEYDAQENDESTDQSMWDLRFAELVEFKKKRGHTLVPKVFPENRQLSYWVFLQRRLYANKEKRGRSTRRISPARIKQLKEIGFVFRAKNSVEHNIVEAARRKPQIDAKWNRFFEEFCEYKEKTGSCHIPKAYKENQALSSWVFTQRHQMKRRNDGKPSLLNDERIEKLNSINFIWHAKKDKEWQDADRARKQAMVEVIWQDHYKSLLKYKAKHGHTRVPKVYKQNQALATWVFRQRAHYRRKQEGEEDIFTDHRLELLDKIGFEWRVRK